MTWQPIETAPKDGTTVLLTGRYSEDFALAQWDERGRDWVCMADGYQVVEHQDYSGIDLRYFSVPSHWMPLPSKPPAEVGS